MCASESCINLFAYVASMVTTDCRIPVGGKILLLADLVDYVSDKCEAITPAPTTATPGTPAPTTAAPTTPTPTTSTPVTTCATKVISSLLTDAYIDQCASDSGYTFTSGGQPDADEVAGMCASSACANLLADVEAMGLSECILPIGNKIYLFPEQVDLVSDRQVDYVLDQCSSPTTSPPTPSPTTETPGTPAPTTAAPTTPTETPGTDAPTHSTTSPASTSPSTEPPATSSPGQTPQSLQRPRRTRRQPRRPSPPPPSTTHARLAPLRGTWLHFPSHSNCLFICAMHTK
ncbi:unnamed protein product [Phytophthora lilii]|uniref:Unnamed protein product n=1 Tax=Phytophthora lilii TaxID=2077276 RepID=A0A9W6TMP6_9STRA|nr:unnamed protein product [Phytophthora lilii]